MQTRLDNEKRVLSVSELNASARLLLEGQFPLVWVEGEISNFARPGSGHWYFTLKDERAQLRCAMFINRNRSVRFKPRDGQQIIVRGRISLYEGRGEFQAIVDDMQPAGEGALRAAFDALKDKLAAEGLFATQAKKPLPVIPRHVVIVTSRTGAALRDILSVLQRRFPLLQVTLIPVSVQGDSAEGEILSALAQIESWTVSGAVSAAGEASYPPPDTVILARGGGSLEDLWTFNLESIARALFDLSLPVISAIGHETDFSISDFVADQRAPTPSAAAELLVPDKQEWLSHLARQQAALAAHIRAALRHETRLLSATASRLTHPGRTLQQQMQRVDHNEQRLLQAITRRLTAARARQALCYARLEQFHPTRELEAAQRQIRSAQQNLRREITHRLERDRSHWRELVARLNAASPLSVLEHGYAILTHPPTAGSRWGAAISSTVATQPGAEISVHLQDGSLQCEVTAVTDSPLASYLGKQAAEPDLA